MKKHRIPENLKYLRAQICVSGRHLCDLLAPNIFFNRSTYGHYEIGANEPHIDAIKAIADFYGITMDELCYGEKPTTNTKINDRQEKRYCGMRVRQGLAKQAGNADAQMMTAINASSVQESRAIGLGPTCAAHAPMKNN